MNNIQVQVLNYSAHAIEDLRELEFAMRVAAPQSAGVVRRLIEMLRSSVKFILPNCGDLIDPDDLRQAHLDLLRLPFPIVAFEVPWEKEGGIEQIGDFKQSPATKRIALCWEGGPDHELIPGLNSILEVFPEGGVFVFPIFWAPALRRWTVSLGGTFVPYDNALDANFESLPASRSAHAAMIEAGLAKPKAKQFRAEPFYLLPEWYENTLAQYDGDKDKVYTQIIIDSRDEAQAVVQACSVINCANVTTAEISPSAALNRKRREKGKQPFFSYKVLQLSDERRESGKEGGGGSHASPRMHLRRGHLRRLGGRAVWVRPAMVNAGASTGAVLKDYAVQSKG